MALSKEWFGEQENGSNAEGSVEMKGSLSWNHWGTRCWIFKPWNRVAGLKHEGTTACHTCLVLPGITDAAGVHTVQITATPSHSWTWKQHYVDIEFHADPASKMAPHWKMPSGCAISHSVVIKDRFTPGWHDGNSGMFPGQVGWSGLSVGCSNQKSLAFILVPSPSYSFFCYLWTHPISPCTTLCEKEALLLPQQIDETIWKRNIVGPVCLSLRTETYWRSVVQAGTGYCAGLHSCTK